MLGNNPFISSIVCGAFSISNSVSLWLGYGADVFVSVQRSCMCNCAFPLFNFVVSTVQTRGRLIRQQCDTFYF
jgi:hypothetical protein